MLVKKPFFILFFLFALLSFSPTICANNNDSLHIKYFTGSNLFSYSFSDTTLSNLIFYQPNSSFTHFAYNTGNVGQAFAPLFFNLNRCNENIFRAFDSYFFSSDSVRYYSTSRPYTEFNYTQGLTKEHLPSVFHTQRLHEQLGLTLNYRVISSDGSYHNQLSRGQSFYTAIDFHSKNGHFLTLLDLTYNSLKVQENGGLTKEDDTLFTNGEVSNRLLLNTNLNGAVNRLKHKSVSSKNYWFLIGENDSIHKHTFRSGLFCDVNASSSSALYTATDVSDVNNILFPNIFLDSTQTRDSIWINKIETFAGFSAGKWGSTFYIPILKLGYKQQWYNESAMNSSFVAAEFVKQSKSFDANVKSHYGLIGRRKNDIKVEFNVAKDLLSEKFRLFANLIYANQKPSYFDDFYISNHHLWNNDFKKQEELNASLKLFIKSMNLSLEGGYQQVSNFILFDINSNIAQLSEKQNISFLSLSHGIQKRWFRSRTFVRYQQSSYAVRVPSVLCRQEVAFLINRKSIHAELGILATYVSNFYGNAYDPSIREYHQQNTYLVGGVTLIDFFASLRVGSAKLYLKADHLNAGFLGYNYQLVPYHPLTDLTWKLGIRWSFWN